MEKSVRLPLIKEDEDIKTLFLSYSSYPGRIVVHMTLDEGYGESHNLDFGVDDPGLTPRFMHQLRTLLNDYFHVPNP